MSRPETRTTGGGWVAGWLGGKRIDPLVSTDRETKKLPQRTTFKLFKGLLSRAYQRRALYASCVLLADEGYERHRAGALAGVCIHAPDPWPGEGQT